MSYRLGYVAQCLTLGITAGHTCRVAGATPARLEALTAQNLAELEQILLFNEKHGIEVFRVGSSVVPLASHPVNRTRWWRTFARDLDRLATIARRSRQRLSMHPPPAGASLSSARAEVRTAAVAELRYSTRLLDALGADRDGRIVVHVGGAAPERPVALEAARRFLEALPEDLRRRLALEHDCRIWSAGEVVPLGLEAGLPVVADTLHHAVLPSSPPIDLRTLLAASAGTFRALGLRPKLHVASQRAGAPPGAHAARIRPADWRAVLEALPGPVDLMLEAKDKDRALFALRRRGLARGEAVGEGAAAAHGAGA